MRNLKWENESSQYVVGNIPSLRNGRVLFRALFKFVTLPPYSGLQCFFSKDEEWGFGYFKYFEVVITCNLKGVLVNTSQFSGAKIYIHIYPPIE